MLNIAIDGYAGSGKSVLAKELAVKLGIKRLDTGAIYRGIACVSRDNGVDVKNEKELQNFVKDLQIQIEFKNDNQFVIINEKDYTPFLREEEISMLSSIVSQYGFVREKVLRLQRRFASENDCIVEGRDIGTCVLPNANYKFFVTADLEIRAKRRFDQMKEKGINESYETILSDLQERDYKDIHRKLSPLKKADDAIVVDNGKMNIEQTVNYCLSFIKR